VARRPHDAMAFPAKAELPFATQIVWVAGRSSDSRASQSRALDLYWPSLPARAGQCFLMAFVPTYRCAAVPDSHRIPSWSMSRTTGQTNDGPNSTDVSRARQQQNRENSSCVCFRLYLRLKVRQKDGQSSPDNPSPSLVLLRASLSTCASGTARRRRTEVIAMCVCCRPTPRRPMSFCPRADPATRRGIRPRHLSGPR